MRVLQEYTEASTEVPAGTQRTGSCGPDHRPVPGQGVDESPVL